MSIKKIRSRLYVGQRNYDFETNQEQGKYKDLNLSEEQWRQVASEELEAVGANELTYVFHDNDFDGEGNKRTLHLHFVARFQHVRDYATTRKAFGCESRNFSKGKSESGALLYLTHTTPESIREKKTRYEVQKLNTILKETIEDEDTGEVKSTFIKLTGEDLESWYRDKIAGKGGEVVSTREDVARLCDELREGLITIDDVLPELQELFDPTTATHTWLNNQGKFERSVDEYYRNKYKEQLRNGREKNLIYIHGLSEVGKTVFARKLGEYYNNLKGQEPSAVHYAPNTSGGSRYDFLGNYENQLVTIFDDIPHNAFSYTDFLSIFEKERVSQIYSRFKDRYWFAELVLITKSTHIDDWTRSLSYSELAREGLLNSNNVLYQPRRRFSYIINLEMDKVTISTYQVLNKRTNEHKLVDIMTLTPKAGENLHSDDFQALVFNEIGKLLGLVEVEAEESKKIVLDLNKQKDKLAEIKAKQTKKAKRMLEVEEERERRKKVKEV